MKALVVFLNLSMAILLSVTVLAQDLGIILEKDAFYGYEFQVKEIDGEISYHIAENAEQKARLVFDGNETIKVDFLGQAEELLFVELYEELEGSPFVFDVYIGQQREASYILIVSTSFMEIRERFSGELVYLHSKQGVELSKEPSTDMFKGFYLMANYMKTCLR